MEEAKATMAKAIDGVKCILNYWMKRDTKKLRVIDDRKDLGKKT